MTQTLGQNLRSIQPCQESIAPDLSPRTWTSNYFVASSWFSGLEEKRDSLLASSHQVQDSIQLAKLSDDGGSKPEELPPGSDLVWIFRWKQMIGCFGGFPFLFSSPLL